VVNYLTNLTATGISSWWRI